MTAVLVAVITPVAAGGVFVGTVELPDDPLVPQASVLYYRDGRTVLARVGVSDRTDVPLKEVPLHVRRAVLAAEDRGFHDHHGVSVRGVARAAWSNLVDGSGEGASTITQQYARNAFLTQERTIGRKAKEIALALKVERRYTKDEILERYLNTVYFGRAAYGIQSAAQAYFGVTVDRLTVAQGAVLAAVIKNPWGLDPAVDRPAAEDRWRWILSAMADAHWLDRQQARSEQYPTVADRPVNAEAIGGPLGIIVDRVEDELSRVGVTPQELRTGGLSVVTTIDEKAQAAASTTVATALTGRPAELRAALVAVEPATGAVRAYHGGADGRGYFDDAAAPRPPGSAFGPVTLASFDRFVALMAHRGAEPYDPQCSDCPLGTRSTESAESAAESSMRELLRALSQQISPEGVRQLAVGMGVSERYGRWPSLTDRPGEYRPGHTDPAVAVGRYPVSPADLAGVYATLAAGGTANRKHIVESVTADEDRWYTATAHRTRPLSGAAAAGVTAMLNRTTGPFEPLPGRPSAAATGTVRYRDTPDSQDAWAAGYTSQLATVVWVGRALPGPIREADGRPIEGAGLPSAMWRDFLTAALAGLPADELPGWGGRGSDLAEPPGPPQVGGIDRGTRKWRPGQTPEDHPTVHPSPGATAGTGADREVGERHVDPDAGVDPDADRSRRPDGDPGTDPTGGLGARRGNEEPTGPANASARP